MAQVPPPPHADGRNIFCADKVDNKDVPAGAIIGFSESPLITILTSPDCTNFDCANNNTNTRSSIIMVNATIAEIITVLIVSSFSYFTNILSHLKKTEFNPDIFNNPYLSLNVRLILLKMRFTYVLSY
jgi:hypothetical protein